ncbi:lytic transglycosylase domain-containing protein [Sphingomonas sp.]|uniref:lytic transglycosylase domain-containing protein n=1 Tax=Sphingomonas sp. TaxID=28214 RepID=UPI0025FF1DC2|nr:lytic transglycosylase domain-containing protein [Sphingomonas sp.]
MAPLILLLATVQAPASSEAASDWRPFVAEAAARFGLPAAWIERVIAVESGGVAVTSKGPIRSAKGAIGLMQLMPDTWAVLRVQLQLGDEPDDPRDNILAGSCYLRMMYDRFGYPGLFAAYNAGPSRYAAWRAGRMTLPAETWQYVARLGESLPRTRLRYRATLRAPAGVPGSGKEASEPAVADGASADLFAIPNRAR